jgi:hypothetical protein
MKSYGQKQKSRESQAPASSSFFVPYLGSQSKIKTQQCPNFSYDSVIPSFCLSSPRAFTPLRASALKGRSRFSVFKLF